MEWLLGLLNEGLLYQGRCPSIHPQTYTICPRYLVFPNVFTLPIPLGPKLTLTVTSHPSWLMAIQKKQVIDFRQTWETYVEKWQQQWGSLARKAKCWRKWNAACVMIIVLKEVGKKIPRTTQQSSLPFPLPLSKQTVIKMPYGKAKRQQKLDFHTQSG